MKKEGTKSDQGTTKGKSGRRSIKEGHSVVIAKDKRGTVEGLEASTERRTECPDPESQFVVPYGKKGDRPGERPRRCPLEAVVKQGQGGLKFRRRIVIEVNSLGEVRRASPDISPRSQKNEGNDEGTPDRRKNRHGLKV